MLDHYFIHHFIIKTPVLIYVIVLAFVFTFLSLLGLIDHNKGGGRPARPSARSLVVKSVHTQVRGRRSFLEEPETLNFSPYTFLADENEEHKEPSQNVTAINDSEEELNYCDTLAGFTVVVVDDEMDALNAPWNTKD